MHILTIHTLTGEAIEMGLKQLTRRLCRLEGIVRVLPCYCLRGDPLALILTTWASAQVWQSVHTTSTLQTLLYRSAGTPACTVHSEQAYNYLWGFYRPGPAATHLALITTMAKDEPHLRACARQLIYKSGIGSAFIARAWLTGDLILAATFNGDDSTTISQTVQQAIASDLPGWKHGSGWPASPSTLLVARILPPENNDCQSTSNGQQHATGIWQHS
jgi:hypothetical protein